MNNGGLILWALILDSFRESFSGKIFWGFAGCSSVVILFFLVGLAPVFALGILWWRFLSIGRDPGWIEIVEGLTVILPFAQDGQPAQAGLGAV